MHVVFPSLSLSIFFLHLIHTARTLSFVVSYLFAQLGNDIVLPLVFSESSKAPKTSLSKTKISLPHSQKYTTTLC